MRTASLALPTGDYEVELWGSPRMPVTRHRVAYVAPTFERPVAFRNTGILVETFELNYFDPEFGGFCRARYAGLRRVCPLMDAAERRLDPRRLPQ